MCLQLLDNKALSLGIIRKTARILAEIMIRKSQALPEAWITAPATFGHSE
jgi:hypothetical protein